MGLRKRDVSSIELQIRIASWWSASADDGALALIRDDFKTLSREKQGDLLDWLPEGSGSTAERIAKVKRVLERAHA